MNMSIKTKKTKRKKINTKHKGKGLTRNLKKIKKHIKNISFDDKDIPEDPALLITEYYAKNLINSRINEFIKIKKKKNLLNKLEKYQDILNLIYSVKLEQDLSAYDYISNIDYIKDIITDVKLISHNDLTDNDINEIQEKLNLIYSEIYYIFEAYNENTPYDLFDSELLEDLD